MAQSKDAFLKPVAILLAVTLVLALGALWVLRPADPGASISQSLTIGSKVGQGSARISKLAIHAAESDGILERTPISGMFSLDLKGAESRSIAVGNRGDALVRVLLETRIAEARESIPTSPPQASIELTHAGGTTRFFLSTIPGPKWIATFETPQAAFNADRDLTKLLSRPSLLQLADTHLMPGLDDRTSDIAISSGSVEIHLVRTPSGWALTAPMNAPADRNTAETTRVVLTDIPGAEVAWDKSPTDDSLGFSSPRAIITAGNARSGGDDALNVYSVKLVLGADADVTGNSIYGLITGTVGGRPILGPYVVKIERATLNRIPLAPAEYVAHTAITLEPSDVRAITIGPYGESPRHTFTLDASGWKRDGVASDAAQTAEIVKLITMLSATRADTLSLAPKPMVGVYSMEIGPREAPKMVALSIGKNTNTWWIQNSHGDLRYKNLPEFGEILEHLAR